ncbi:MAG TPA: hypothetical protein VMP89_18950, partial [Solirubrobacteraceae bacterium]|nr:hypothetical protein [Solirubrobacteraceae bacterium]
MTSLLGALAVLLLTAAAASAEAPPKHRGAPKISGSFEDGRVLTVSEGRWKATTQPTFSYQWEVCLPKQLTTCTLIPGAESASYRIASSEIADRLRAIVTATTPGGKAVANSHPTKKIKPGSPIAVEAPAIVGSLQEGTTLTADPGNWAGTPPMSFHYQWERCAVLSAICEEIAGATAATYTLQALDVASKLLVQVKASNAYGSATASSAETPVVGAILPVNKLLPVIGGLLQDGQLLSATSGLWSGTEPISYAYRWLLCNAAGESCSEIGGASGSMLKLLSTEIGDTLRVVVTATNGAGSTEATSAPTELIAGILPKNTGLPSISGL